MTSQCSNPLLVDVTPENSALRLLVHACASSSFNNCSSIVIGPSEVIVIDTGYARSDALRIAAAVLDSERKLTTIFISNADPDYYFGAATLKSIFPEARILATPAVRARIAQTIAAKLEYWGLKMGVNKPPTLLVPDTLHGNVLHVDGYVLEVRGTEGVLDYRPWVWIPSLRAIVGNVGIFGGFHVWTADTQEHRQRAAWIEQLQAMAALQPSVVVPGHLARAEDGSLPPLDMKAITHTCEWLQDFEVQLGRIKAAGQDSAELVAVMKARYPSAGFDLALELGAAVALGEQPW